MPVHTAPLHCPRGTAPTAVRAATPGNDPKRPRPGASCSYTTVFTVTLDSSLCAGDRNVCCETVSGATLAAASCTACLLCLLVASFSSCAAFNFAFYKFSKPGCTGVMESTGVYSAASAFPFTLPSLTDTQSNFQSSSNHGQGPTKSYHLQNLLRCRFPYLFCLDTVR